ncbi:hypothetical protein ACTWP5_22235 [Streptomyces sp. 4N509B]|uniref:hypothetical protein n=1 Tax=Streptomyces sp. 4N509B TaxID=3457413 RepID=UPI003FD58A5F
MESRTLLHLLVQQRRWTYDVFRRAYEKAAREVATTTGDPSIGTATVSEQSYRRWTAGKVRSLPNWPASTILEHMFGRPVGEILAPPANEVAAPLPCGRATDESEMRMTARNAADHAGEAAAQSLPDLTIDQVEDDVRTLARIYLHTAPAEAYRRGAELLHVSQAMLDRTQRVRQRERLYLQAGATAALMASASFDLGSLPTAVQLARTAALYGEVIDHGPLQAYAHGALAYLAYWDGRPADAVRLARSSRSFGGLGDTGALRLAVIAARAHAHVGDQEGAQRAMQDATRCDTGRRDDLHDDVGGEFGMPPARAAMSTATTYLLLRDADGAEETATRALELFDADGEQPTLRGKASIDLARARIAGGELDGAAEAAQPVLALGSEWSSLGLVQRVASLRADLTCSHLDAPVIRELGAACEDFTASRRAVLGASAPLALGR